MKARPHRTRRAGVEEQKEEIVSLGSKEKETHNVSHFEEKQHGFQAQVDSVATLIMGSCGAALDMVERQTCALRKSSEVTTMPVAHSAIRAQQPQELSVMEDLKKLAVLEGNSIPRATDIPKFLVEDAVHSFDADDDVSALSQFSS